MADDKKTDTPDDKGGDDKTFTQADVDRIVADRLTRERTKYADYDDLKAKADKFDEAEAANKSDLDKATEKLTKAEQRAAEAEQRALRLEVAQDKGLTPAQAKRLAGTSKEELEADADELLETFAPAANNDGGEPTGTSRRPKEALTPGASNDDDGDEVDIRSIVDAIPRGI